MALLLGVSKTDIQQCFQAWQTGSPCVQMEGKYIEWDHTLSNLVLLLPKYRMTLITRMTPPSQSSLLRKMLVPDMFNFVHDCKANPNLSDDALRKISYAIHCFLHKNFISR